MSYLLISAQQFKCFGCFCGILKIILHLKKSSLWINIVSTHCNVKVKWNSYINNWNKCYPTQMVNTQYTEAPTEAHIWNLLRQKKADGGKGGRCTAGVKEVRAHVQDIFKSYDRYVYTPAAILLYPLTCDGFLAVWGRRRWTTDKNRREWWDVIRQYLMCFSLLSLCKIFGRTLTLKQNISCSIDSNKLWNNEHDDWKSLCTQWLVHSFQGNYISHDSCCLL